MFNPLSVKNKLRYFVFYNLNPEIIFFIVWYYIEKAMVAELDLSLRPQISQPTYIL